jgi:hypothetical protein
MGAAGANSGNACHGCSRRVRGKWRCARYGWTAIVCEALLAGGENQRTVRGDGNGVLSVCAS